MTLLDQAMQSKASRDDQPITPDVIELAIAYFEGGITIGQARAVIGQGAYIILCRALRQAVTSGMLKISQ